MKLFESDNIWKRKMREEKAAKNPPTAHSQWEEQVRSNRLWLIGGLAVVLLSIFAVLTGAMELNLTAIAIIVIVGLYCAMTVKQLLDLKNQEPPLTAAEKKQRKQ